MKKSEEIDFGGMLANIMAIIEARSDEVISKWQSFFGETRFYC